MVAMHLLSLSRTILPRHTTLTEHLSKNPLTNSGVKTGKIKRIYEATGVDLQTLFLYHRRMLELCFFFLSISQAAAREQENEFLLISILVFYLFTFL